MECPYCKAEMEKGVIDSQHEISWTDKRHLFSNAIFHNKAVVLSEHSFIKGSAVVAYLCRNCEKVVIDYKDKKSDCNRK